ncbi:MAG: VWA domain-containing protein [Planctomycetes bacterium]|nr:VWA domain-containing protein [Planctomycetota bacterium]
MEWRYSQFDPELEGLTERLKHLQRLFRELLLHTDGDVEQALLILAQVGKRYGLLDERLTIEQYKEWLEQRQSIARDRAGRARLTKRGEQELRAGALEQLFGGLANDARGDHRVQSSGTGVERLSETRAWGFGDALHLVDAQESLKAALARTGTLELAEEDLRVHETEHLTSCATVLLIDVSHSMVLYGEDRITPAKRVALSLVALIQKRYPKDALHVVQFGDEAREIPIDELPYLSAGPFHTNTKAGLELARELLRRKAQTNRQIVMLTDGKPSALTERDGTIYKNPFGLDRRIVNKTLEEADHCRRLGIPITTFMLTTDPTLVEFVETFTEVNHGRAYYSQLDELGSYVLVDYVRNKRRVVRG